MCWSCLYDTLLCWVLALKESENKRNAESRLLIILALNQACLEWGLWLMIKLLWLSYCLIAELQFLSACRLLACDKHRVGHLSLSLFYNSSALSWATLTIAVVKLQHGSLLSSINLCVSLISRIAPGACHRAQSSNQLLAQCLTVLPVGYPHGTIVPQTHWASGPVFLPLLSSVSLLQPTSAQL